jgi:hypothetical protein
MPEVIKSYDEIGSYFERALHSVSFGHLASMVGRDSILR